MRRVLLLILLAPLGSLAACGKDDQPKSPEAVAGEWVKAINAKDWERACDLSVQPPADSGMSCTSLLDDALGDSDPNMSLEGIYMSGDSGNFSVSRPVEGLSEFGLERHDGTWRVHFEVQVIH